eukprot:Skav231242  [mRNA]  locus=scaffold411:67593:73128:+ [translate_table: standard]
MLLFHLRLTFDEAVGIFTLLCRGIFDEPRGLPQRHARQEVVGAVAQGQSQLLSLALALVAGVVLPSGSLATIGPTLFGNLRNCCLDVVVQIADALVPFAQALPLEILEEVHGLLLANAAQTQ